MKIETSWNENLKMLLYFVLFFAITGGIRWYASLDDTEIQEVQETKQIQTEDYFITDEDFETVSTTSEQKNIFKQ